MIKHLYLFCLLISSAIYGQIIEMARFSELEKHLAEDTLILLDIDDTLLIPVQMLGCDLWFEARNAVYRDLGLSESECLEKALAEWEAVRHLTQMDIVEEGTQEYVRSLQDRKYPVMGLTTQGLALSTRTKLQLLAHQIDLSKTAPSQQDHFLSLNGHGVLFRAGILFTSGSHKGKALFAILEQMGYLPKRILFVNDKYSHLSVVEETAKERGVDFVGFRYAYSDARKAAFDLELAHYQFTHSTLDHLLSDEEARKATQRAMGAP